MHSIIIYFSQRPPARVRQEKQVGSNWGCYYFLFEKKTVQRVV